MPAVACPWSCNRSVSPQTSTDVTSSPSIEQHGRQLNGNPTWSADRNNCLRKLGHALITLCGCCGRSRAWRLNRPRTSLQSEALPHPVFPWTALPKERPPTRRASMHRAPEIRARGCLGPSVVPAGVCARTFPSECIVLQGPWPVPRCQPLAGAIPFVASYPCHVIARDSKIGQIQRWSCVGDLRPSHFKRIRRSLVSSSRSRPPLQDRS